MESDDEGSAHGSDGGYGSDGGGGGGGVVDVEDIGGMLAKQTARGAGGPPKPMVSDSLRASLSKQGRATHDRALLLASHRCIMRGECRYRYKIVGTHSGVKICRWTKSMLRGRGGCYKHTFYGIVSYQCMEASRA